MTRDALEVLGTIHQRVEQRDAVHLAVAPVEAGSNLAPGERICVIEGKAYTGTRGKPVGIVDPFLDRLVAKGERFYCMLFPRTITSLRHVWEHPDFDAQDKEASEQWIRNWCAGIPLDYETVMAGAQNYVKDRAEGGFGYFINEGDLLENETVPAEFWDHFDVVTGSTTPKEQRGSFFTCSC